MSFQELSDNLVRVREKIASVQANEGLDTDVRIVAVTKGHLFAAVEAAAAVGLREVGENRIQEALGKQDIAGDLDVEWHLIGHLQTNKAKHVPNRFSLVHSVDSMRLADALEKAALRKQNDPLGVLVQVNVAGESQKNGCLPEEAEEIAGKIAESQGLELKGLMTMAPYVKNEVTLRKVFSSLRRIRDQLEKAGYPARELSMGMSNDYEAAVAEGATILRLGTTLFGERRK